MTPVLVLKLSPAGRDVGLTLHVNGLVPPDSVKVVFG
jgi:hypothetical protein